MEKTRFDERVNREGFIGLFKNKLLLGYLILYRSSSYGHLSAIGVNQKYHRQGIGSKLMEYALNYYKNKNIQKIRLYVEQNNTPAIKLYKKYDFKVLEESWHYIIDLSKYSIKYDKLLLKDTVIRDLRESDLENVIEIFPHLIFDELKGLMIRPSNKLFGLFHKDKLQVIARFDPNFSGCRPFAIKDLSFFDIFLKKLESHKREDKNYYRITFESNKELAKLCNERTFTLHHHMNIMDRILVL
jgi:hypothetical protein